MLTHPNQRLARGIIFTILLIITLINLSPGVFAFYASLKGKIEFARDMYSWPQQIDFQNYRTLLQQENYGRYIVNSLILTISSTAIALFVATMAAYAFAWGRFPGRRQMFNLNIALMAIPPIVVVIPIFIQMTRLRLINTYPSAIIAYVGFILPFSIFIMTGYFYSLPRELLEAARVDGATRFQTLFYIVLPMAKAPLMTLAVINGLWVWNELLIALLFLQNNDLRTLMVSLSFHRGKDMQDVPVIMAGAILSSIPTLATIILAQRFIVRGFLGGAIKG
jgi:raffinose/stachyose/melibiose transport system permease protein